MHLQIEQLIPIPLQENVLARESGIWNKTLSLSAPDYISLQAPSGTGKTTLIHCLYGVRNDYSGNILWQGKNLRNFSAEELAALRARELSVIFQDLRLFPELSAWENLMVKKNLSAGIEEKEIASWMDRLGIGHKKNATGKTLSYGEQQRLAIIRALIQPFQFLLMDEPFSHLDQRNTEIARELILEIVQRNKAGLLLADLDQNTF
ncbi:MAG TPA: ATP-binding cassette domain-containing protein, partial [Chitinophagaceae bacterium]|nr:ATP-binding cassette domain-containing protein [Chitinophagaceae bacterium]